MDWWRLISFVVVATLFLGSMHRYVWLRLARDTRLPTKTRRTLRIVLLMLGMSIPAGWLLGRGLGIAAASWLTITAFVWLGTLFYLVIAMGVWDVGRLTWRIGDGIRAKRRSSTQTPCEVDHLPNPERRVLLARVGAAGATLAAGGVSLGGLYAGLGEITLPEVVVKLPRLPPALNGLRIALMSDIHIGPLLDARFLRGVVEKTNALRPDLVAIVGDLVDGSVANLGRHVAPLQHLRSRYGTYFVTGNHEYYSGAEAWTAFLERLDIRVLMNERVVLGDAGGRFELAGVPDHHAARYAPIESNMQRAAAGRDPDNALVMLAHQPVQVAQAAPAGVDLQLSGHTHGGQMFPFGGLTRLVQPYLAGLHEHAPGTQIYVSRGTGFWGPPMRVLAPAEITSIILVT